MLKNRSCPVAKVNKLELCWVGPGRESRDEQGRDGWKGKDSEPWTREGISPEAVDRAVPRILWQLSSGHCHWSYIMARGHVNNLIELTRWGQGPLVRVPVWCLGLLVGNSEPGALLAEHLPCVPRAVSSCPASPLSSICGSVCSAWWGGSGPFSRLSGPRGREAIQGHR